MGKDLKDYLILAPFSIPLEQAAQKRLCPLPKDLKSYFGIATQIFPCGQLHDLIATTVWFEPLKSFWSKVKVL